MKLPANLERDFGIQRQDEKGFSPYPNAFRLTPLGNVLEKEPNDDQAHATPFDAPMAVNGVIEKPGDVDQFVFKATKGQVFDIHCYARRIRSPLDPVMYLGKKGAGAMLGADDSFGPDSYFRFQAPEDAEYVVWLIDQLGKGGPDYFYRIEVTPVVPQLHDDDQRRADSAGNRRHVDRRSQGKSAGDPDLRQSRRFRRRGQSWASAALPAGVTVEAPTIAASQVRGAGAFFGQARCGTRGDAGGGHAASRPTPS